MQIIILTANTFISEIIRILIGFISLSVLGTLIALLLSLASKKLAVKKDQKVAALEDAFPGLNCGSCGYAGCAGYAEALAKEEDDDITKCKPGGASCLAKVASIMGKQVNTDIEERVAYLHCLGDNSAAVREFRYNGIKDCNAAKIFFNGDKSCKYSCLGLGSCIEVCPVDAISLNKQKGLVKVDTKKCIGCEKCIDICPSGVLKMIPKSADFIVACNSNDKGKITKTNCNNGCFACMICEKKFPEAGFKVQDNLSSVDFSVKSNVRGAAAEKCPAKCIVEVE